MLIKTQWYQAMHAKMAVMLLNEMANNKKTKR
ncbi:hypothetical protein BH11BAC7_BH11BAC7_11400 [soil metagenome]